MKINVRIGDETYEVEMDDLSARPIIAIIDGERFEVWPEREAEAEAAPKRTSNGSLPSPLERTTAFLAEPNGSSPKNGTGGPEQPASSLKGMAIGGESEAQSQAQQLQVRAPIPGVVLSVAVKPGAHVSAGQELCTIEAMKMKNVIRATRDARIAAVHISPSEHVRHQQLLIEYEA